MLAIMILGFAYSDAYLFIIYWIYHIFNPVGRVASDKNSFNIYKAHTYKF